MQNYFQTFILFQTKITESSVDNMEFFFHSKSVYFCPFFSVTLVFFGLYFCLYTIFSLSFWTFYFFLNPFVFSTIIIIIVKTIKCLYMCVFNVVRITIRKEKKKHSFQRSQVTFYLIRCVSEWFFFFCFFLFIHFYNALYGIFIYSHSKCRICFSIVFIIWLFIC